MPLYPQPSPGAVTAQFRSTLWSTPPHVTRSTIVASTDLLFMTPLRIRQTVLIDAMGVEVTSVSANTTAKVGIWSSTGNNDFPGALIAQTTDLDTHTGTGLVSSTNMTTNPVSLSPGTYWVGAVTQAATPGPTLRSMTASPEAIPISSGSIIGTVTRLGVGQTGVSGALPDPANPATGQSAVPIVFLRAV